MKGGKAGTLRKTAHSRFGQAACALMNDRVRSPLPNGAGRDVGIGFRYAPKRYALRAPLGLRSSRRHITSEWERRQQGAGSAFRNQLQIAELDAHN